MPKKNKGFKQFGETFYILEKVIQDISNKVLNLVTELAEVKKKCVNVESSEVSETKVDKEKSKK